MKKKSTKPKKTIGQELIEETVHNIIQLLHIKLPTQKLVQLRDIIITQRIRNWDKKSFLGKALKFHYQNANLRKFENINYLHLLMAELIRNFSVATKEEYLKKCEEYRIYPFQDKIISKKSLTDKKLTFEEVMDHMKDSFKKMKEKGEQNKSDEVSNALNQDYPICSFDDLLGKSRLN